MTSILQAVLALALLSAGGTLHFMTQAKVSAISDRWRDKIEALLREREIEAILSDQNFCNAAFTGISVGSAPSIFHTIHVPDRLRLAADEMFTRDSKITRVILTLQFQNMPTSDSVPRSVVMLEVEAKFNGAPQAEIVARVPIVVRRSPITYVMARYQILNCVSGEELPNPPQSAPGCSSNERVQGVNQDGSILCVPRNQIEFETTLCPPGQLLQGYSSGQARCVNAPVIPRLISDYSVSIACTWNQRFPIILKNEKVDHTAFVQNHFYRPAARDFVNLPIPQGANYVVVRSHQESERFAISQGQGFGISAEPTDPGRIQTRVRLTTLGTQAWGQIYSGVIRAPLTESGSMEFFDENDFSIDHPPFGEHRMSDPLVFPNNSRVALTQQFTYRLAEGENAVTLESIARCSGDPQRPGANSTFVEAKLQFCTSLSSNPAEPCYRGTRVAP
jgi:hypothetical protein